LKKLKLSKTTLKEKHQALRKEKRLTQKENIQNLKKESSF